MWPMVAKDFDVHGIFPKVEGFGLNKYILVKEKKNC
jgi:hypothetical protein